MKNPIPFNKAFLAGAELDYIRQAIASGQLAGDAQFTHQCQEWLEKHIGCKKALLTHSCTAALEMAAILLDIQACDEIIMPSYTFVSTANAFVLRGGVPVFVDIRPDTLNIDEHKIEAAITEKTKAIVVVHYAGVACEMDYIMALAKKHNLYVVEDAAQAISSRYKNKPLGSIGHLAALSFHNTKNIISGEGGALLINDAKFIDRAEIIREKGTNRTRFFRGQVDKYTWVDVGSSFLPSDIIAAILLAQLETSDTIIQKRLISWNLYQEHFLALEQAKIIRRPIIPEECQHNGHIYYLLLQDLPMRTALINKLKDFHIDSTFHYVPLHSSPAGLELGRTPAPMTVTDNVSETLLRLPLWVGIEESINDIIAKTISALTELNSAR